MRYTVEHANAHRLRIRLSRAPLGAEEQQILEYALGQIRGVERVTIYPATGGVVLEFPGGDMDLVRRKLDAFAYENVQYFARQSRQEITPDELHQRKLDAELKTKLRVRILLEAAADMVLPAPVSLGYHAWQLITLKNL